MTGISSRLASSAAGLVPDAAQRAARAPRLLRAGRFTLALDRPLIMGVVNVTPDSFSDGGEFLDTARAIARARALIEQGADILDIGGESTRPGALPVEADQELARVLPVIDALREAPVPLSIDTRKAAVMREALARGVSMVNDIHALQAHDALEAVRASDCAVCLMHMQGEPQSMQQAPQYRDVVAEVDAFLRERVRACERAGLRRERLTVDPGFGFGKTHEHSLALLRALPALAADQVPLVAGLSRKSLLGRITGRAPHERLAASVTAAVLAAQRGAAIVRVHDVAATHDALRVLRAVDEIRGET